MSLILEEITISLKRGKKLIDGLSLSVAHGEIFTVMGPSGSGKSTLLDAVGGNLGKNFDLKGELTLNEQDLLLLPPEKRNIGLLYQDAILFPHLSVGENLAFGLKDKKSKDAQSEELKLIKPSGRLAWTAFMIVTRLPFLEVSGLVQR